MARPAITVRNLHKSYGKLKVLNGVSFNVPKGSIVALLGPNGAGKTTTVRILSTLLMPDKGTATINGYDVLKDADKVHSSIGLTGQYAAVDGYLSGEENLLLMGRLYRMGLQETKQRAKELLEEFDLVEAASRTVKTYSGGMKRRIDLAMSLIASPPVIFLDEPTTGLDPRSRMTMWETIRRLAKGGTTILLTTQYMEEADQLADNIIVIDGGKVIAEGTSDQLKAKVAADRLEVTISAKSSFEKAKEAINSSSLIADKDSRVISVASAGGISTLKKTLAQLEAAKISVDNVSLRRPTLDDVFLNLTGHKTVEDTETDTKGSK